MPTGNTTLISSSTTETAESLASFFKATQNAVLASDGIFAGSEGSKDTVRGASYGGYQAWVNRNLTYQFSSLEWRGRRLELRFPIICKPFRDGSLYVIEYAPLGIHSYAETVEDVVRDFTEEFFLIWEDYGLAPDEELAPSGLRLKARLKEIVLRETAVDAA